MKPYEIAAIMISVSLSLVGCGPDIDVQPHATTGSGGSAGDGSGGGGFGGNGSGGNGSGGGGGGNGLACSTLVVQPTTIAVTAMAQSSPRIALDPSTGHVLYTFLNGPSGSGSSLHAMTTNAFDAWPPNWTPAELVDTDVLSYAISTGPAGPIGYVRHANTPPRLIDSFLPQVKFVDTPLTDEGDPQFVAAIVNRTFWGAVRDVGMYEVLHLGSYQPGSIPQSDQPLTCAKTKLQALAQPSNNGFIAAMLEPNLPNNTCDPLNPTMASNVSISRYDSDDALGSTLKPSQGWRFTMDEPVVNLGLARTSDGGAWVVFQTDGSTSVAIPPAFAARALPSGYVIGDGAMDPISPGGAILRDLATAALQDTLVAAWIDAIDPSAPVILIQLHDLGKPMGLSTSIPTNDAWYDGDLQLVVSNEKRSMLVAWTSQSITAFARVDCVP